MRNDRNIFMPNTVKGPVYTRDGNILMIATGENRVY